MKKKQIFIHLGFPKTASTYLQINLLPLMKETFYLGKPFNDGTIRILEKKILKLNEIEYEKERENLIHSLEKIFNKTSNKYILSHEGFLRYTRYNDPKNLISNDIFQTLKRLDEIFSNYCEVNFIIVIRRYEDIIRSYLDHFHTTFKFEYNENTFLKDLRENRTNSNILQNFYYGEIIKFIEKLKINHKVLIYEDLKNNPKVFHQQLFNFIGTHIDNNTLTLLNDSNNSFNSSEINFSIRDTMLHRIKVLLDKLSNMYRKGDLLKKLFKLSSYIKLIKNIIYSLSYKKIRKKKFFYNQFLPSKYKKDIFNFYVTDFKKLPKDIQIKCDKYNYLDK